MTDIPLVDLRAQHEQVADEVAPDGPRSSRRPRSSAARRSPRSRRSSRSTSASAHCVAVGNGTDAIELALRAAGVGPGDECVLPANTFVATAEAVARAGATRCSSTATEDTALMDVERLADAVGPRTRAILPVHLYGQAAPVEQVRPVADAVGAVGRRGRGPVAGSPARRASRRARSAISPRRASTPARTSARTATAAPS